MNVLSHPVEVNIDEKLIKTRNLLCKLVTLHTESLNFIRRMTYRLKTKDVVILDREEQYRERRIKETSGTTITE